MNITSQSHKIISVITIIMLTILANMTLQAASNKHASTTSYHVTIDENNTDIALVTGRFVLQSDTFYMFSGANNHDKRWAKFVSNFVLKTSDGITIPSKQNEDGSWVISEMISDEIIMSYQVNLDHENHEWSGGIDGAAYAREDGVFYTGRSLFIANGDNRENIKVTFSIADDWKVSTSWQDTNSKNTFIASNLDALGYSMFFAGTHTEEIIKEDNFEVIFALGGSVEKYQDEFINIAQGIFKYYVDLMGGLPKTSNGDAIKSVVVINAAQYTDGEVVGNDISILLDPNGDPMSQTIARFILVHEFFHLWNGKSFAPDDAESMEWFKEGFSNYYTLKALHHVGFLNNQSYIEIFENFFHQRYITDPGLGDYPITDGSRKHSNWGLIYGGGMMNAIALDMIFRQASDNKRNLDNVMRKVYTTYYDENYYSLADIKKLLEVEHESSLDSFFSDYILGLKTVPMAKYLQNAGINSNPDGLKLNLSLEQNPTDNQKAIRASFMGELN